ncbi:MULTISPECIES: ATP-binding protein [unclassified Fusibacter]|uniref:ATP-binding protein n=1 Tax=unclassified Fusibacter TaxID=2624464 RepID=UPI001013B415|nr:MULTISPECIES: ATP-binding protein [unclassified Fusibacter]MCK8060790.1 ATP-binding protein [Fusibacter sp. A2]NPE23086.1 ATP-binding protein [Fusibacter sp. A1]RXV59756.1 ATP-binding protein [Fusibacter sp. A1]
MVIYQNKIESTFVAVDGAVHRIIDALKDKCGLDNKTVLFKISFMLREMLNNAVEHGNEFDKNKMVSCEVDCSQKGLSFVISDEGEGIDFTCNPFHIADDKLLRERNRGYMTIQEMAFGVMIEGNKVTVTLELDQEAERWKSM